MKRRCYLRQLILVLSCVLSFTLGFAQSKADKVKALLDAYSAAAQLNATVLVSCKGKILLHEGFGYKNATDKTVNTSASVFQIGSLTKQFTAAGILKLVEAGKLRVQDKLQRFFPELPKSDSITVKHLLTHTSGIFNYTNDKAFMKNVAAHSLSEKSLVDFLTTKPINFSPGSNYEYSNSGYMLLGYIIQKVSKKPYEQFIRETIFQPLRMTTSGFDFAHYSGTNKTKGYAVLNDTESKEAFVMDSSVSYSAGAIFSSTGDLFKWHQALSSATFLEKSLLQKIFTPFKAKYGYGWGLDSFYGRQVFYHGGAISGYRAYILREPKDGICIILLSNSQDRRLPQLCKSIFALLVDQPYSTPSPGDTTTTNEVDRFSVYAGEYRLSANTIITVSLEGRKLYGQPTGQQGIELELLSGDTFLVKGSKVKLEFVRDASRKVNGLILHSNGKAKRAEKNRFRSATG